MKKTLTAAALSSVLVLGLASAALAVHETATAETTGVVTMGASKVTIDGNVRERGYYDAENWNDDDSDGDFSAGTFVDNGGNSHPHHLSSGKAGPGRTFYDSRVQLGVKAQVSPEATGYIKLESFSGNRDTDVWGEDANAGLFDGGHKDSALYILEAWVNYQPGMWGVKAGHMPLALGNKIFFDHTGSGDDALVFYANPNEATHIAALTIKFNENRNASSPYVGTARNDNSDDLDGYVGLITHKLNDNVNLGANWTYLRGGSEDTSGFMTGEEPFPGLSMHNVGLTADGKVGAIEYLADLELQFGDVQSLDAAAGNESPVDEVDADGWAMKLGGKYDLGAGKIGLLFGYGSGDDDEDVNDDMTDTDNNMDHEGFINFLTDTTYDTIIAGYRAAIPGANSWAGATNAQGKNTGLANLTLYQLNGSTKVVCPLTGKDLSLFSSLSYMQLSEDAINGMDAGGDVSKVDNVGTELDLIAKWALTPGLTYAVEAAYLWTGDVYETVNGHETSDAEDLAFIRHGLDLKF